MCVLRRFPVSDEFILNWKMFCVILDRKEIFEMLNNGFFQVGLKLRSNLKNLLSIILKCYIQYLYKIIGKTGQKESSKEIAVSATSVSEITGIPRATCIRKLKKLVVLGFLIRLTKSKRYFVNQSIEGKTKNIFTKDSINFTIETYSQYLATILNSLIQNQKQIIQVFIN